VNSPHALGQTVLVSRVSSTGMFTLDILFIKPLLVGTSASSS
jgi:hypothetical protein